MLIMKITPECLCLTYCSMTCIVMTYPFLSIIIIILATNQNAVHNKASEELFPTLNNPGSSVDIEDTKVILREDPASLKARYDTCSYFVEVLHKHLLNQICH